MPEQQADSIALTQPSVETAAPVAAATDVPRSAPVISTPDSLGSAVAVDSPDSIAVADSVTVAPVVTIVEEPELPAAWLDGLLPVERPGLASHNQGYVSIIVVIMLALCLSFKSLQRVCGILVRRLWTTRSRQVFDDTTASEKRTVGLLMVMAVFFIGLMASAGLSWELPGAFRFTPDTTLTLGLMAAAYFAFQYVTYFILGYTFTTTEGERLWIEGFTASMSLLGLGLLVPGLLVLFYPDLTMVAVGMAATLYVAARIMFICKGFRIFYTNLGSLVYFILYLCSLEIIPVIFLFYSSIALCS